MVSGATCLTCVIMLTLPESHSSKLSFAFCLKGIESVLVKLQQFKDHKYSVLEILISFAKLARSLDEQSADCFYSSYWRKRTLVKTLLVAQMVPVQLLAMKGHLCSVWS